MSEEKPLIPDVHTVWRHKRTGNIGKIYAADARFVNLQGRETVWYGDRREFLRYWEEAENLESELIPMISQRNALTKDIDRRDAKAKAIRDALYTLRALQAEGREN